MVRPTLRPLFFVLPLLLIAQWAWPWAYTNSGQYYMKPAPVGFRAIDLILAANRAVLAGTGKRFVTSPDGAQSTIAGDQYYNDFPFFWIDVSRVINPQHRALGFIDFMVTTIIDDAPGVSVSGPGVAPFTNGWRMQGDSDRRDNQDIRAYADGWICEFMDTRWKGSYWINKGYDDGSVAIMSVYNRRGTQLTYYSGEYAILRMQVPRFTVRSYNLFLGANILRPYPATAYYGQNPPIQTGVSGDYNNGQGLAYQVFAYTPVLTNSLIPIVDIKSPSVDGVYIQRYDEEYGGSLRSAFREVRIPSRVPVVFTAENSYMSNLTVVKYEWKVESSNDWVPGGPTYTAFFQTNGFYQVQLRLTTDTGIVAANNGSSNETGTNNMPDFYPSALPLMVTVTAPPAIAAIQECRPNPFIIGQHANAMLDFTLKEDTPVTVSIYSLDGRLIKNLLTSQTKYPAGYWSVGWDGKDDRAGIAPEGIYFAVLITSSGKYMTKIHVLRSN